MDDRIDEILRSGIQEELLREAEELALELRRTKPEGVESEIAIKLRIEGALTRALCKVHEYAQYVGLVETYEYCIRCDEKRDVK